MKIVVKNFLSLLLGNIFARIVSFIIAIYLARNFGPKDFGLISFSTAFITYYIMLSNFGLQSLGIIEVAKNKKEIKETVDIILSLRIVLSIVSFILLVITLILLKQNNETKLMTLLSGLSILVSSFAVDWIFNATQQMKYISYSIIINNLMYLVILIIFLLGGIYKKVYIVPIASSVSSLISSLYLIRLYLTKYKYKFKFDKTKYLEILARAWPFFFSGIFANINCNIDTIILGFMKTSTEVGLYNSVYKIVNVLILFIGFIFVPIYPLMIEYFNNKEYNLLNNIMDEIRRIIYIIAVFIFCLAFVLGKESIYTLYGKQYSKATTTFTILMVYVALVFVREIYGRELTAWNMQKKYMNIVLVSSFYNIVSNLLLIPRFGIEGSAFTTLVSEIINLVLMYRVSRKTIKLKFSNVYVIKIIISGILMSMGIVFLKTISSNAFILLGLGSMIYLFGIFGTKAITIGDIKKALYGGK